MGNIRDYIGVIYGLYKGNINIRDYIWVILGTIQG